MPSQVITSVWPKREYKGGGMLRRHAALRPPNPEILTDSKGSAEHPSPSRLSSSTTDEEDGGGGGGGGQEKQGGNDADAQGIEEKGKRMASIEERGLSRWSVSTRFSFAKPRGNDLSEKGKCGIDGSKKRAINSKKGILKPSLGGPIDKELVQAVDHDGMDAFGARDALRRRFDEFKTCSPSRRLVLACFAEILGAFVFSYMAFFAHFALLLDDYAFQSISADQLESAATNTDPASFKTLVSMLHSIVLFLTLFTSLWAAILVSFRSWGAQLAPQVTVVCASTGLLPIWKAPFHILSQCLGLFLGQLCAALCNWQDLIALRDTMLRRFGGDHSQFFLPGEGIPPDNTAFAARFIYLKPQERKWTEVIGTELVLNSIIGMTICATLSIRNHRDSTPATVAPVAILIAAISSFLNGNSTQSLCSSRLASGFVCWIFFEDGKSCFPLKDGLFVFFGPIAGLFVGFLLFAVFISDSRRSTTVDRTQYQIEKEGKASEEETQDENKEDAAKYGEDEMEHMEEDKPRPAPESGSRNVSFQDARPPRSDAEEQLSRPTYQRLSPAPIKRGPHITAAPTVGLVSTMVNGGKFLQQPQQHHPNIKCSQQHPNGFYSTVCPPAEGTYQISSFPTGSSLTPNLASDATPDGFVDSCSGGLRQQQDQQTLKGEDHGTQNDKVIPRGNEIVGHSGNHIDVVVQPRASSRILLPILGNSNDSTFRPVDQEAKGGTHLSSSPNGAPPHPHPFNPLYPHPLYSAPPLAAQSRFSLHNDHAESDLNSPSVGQLSQSDGLSTGGGKEAREALFFYASSPLHPFVDPSPSLGGGGGGAGPPSSVGSSQPSPTSPTKRYLDHSPTFKKKGKEKERGVEEMALIPVSLSPAPRRTTGWIDGGGGGGLPSISISSVDHPSSKHTSLSSTAAEEIRFGRASISPAARPCHQEEEEEEEDEHPYSHGFTLGTVQEAASGDEDCGDEEEEQQEEDDEEGEHNVEFGIDVETYETPTSSTFLQQVHLTQV